MRWARAVAKALSYIFLSEHVADGVVYQDAVEFCSEANGTHIAEMMLDRWVQALGQGQHFFGDVDCGGIVVGGQVGEEVAAAHSEFEDGMASRAELTADDVEVDGFLVGVLFRRAEEGPKIGKVAV